nr:hypothetical protein [uncultured Fretibacterium sp.]
MRRRRGSCLLQLLLLILYGIIFYYQHKEGCDGCSEQARGMWRAARHNANLPRDEDLAPLHGGSLFWWSEESLNHPRRNWEDLTNYKLASWRERPYVLTYFASEDIYLTGCEVLEKPEALDVTFRIVSPPSGQIRKVSERPTLGYSAEIVTMLGLRKKEELPAGGEYLDFYKLRLGFHFVTVDGRPFVADSTVGLIISY